MTVSLQRIDQIHKPDTWDDTLNAAAVAGVEGSAVDFADAANGMLSQLKRIIYGSSAGNWYDDVESAGDSLNDLAARATLEGKLILLWKLNLTDVTVGGSDNWVTLDAAGEPPSENIAINVTTKGAVAAQLSGAVGSNDLTEIAGTNALKPKNLCAVFDGATGDALLSGGRRIWALLQVGSVATDGNAFATSGNDLGQLSFVRPNATFDDLEACPAADIQGKTIIYAYAQRNDLNSFAEDAFRGDLGEADPSVGVTVSLDSAYDGGNSMEVDANDVDIRLADTKSWIFRKGAAGVILWQLTRNDGGTDTLTFGSDLDLFDNNAADNDFAQGMAVDSADQAINIGKTAVGKIDSASLTLTANTGDNSVESTAGDVKFKTVRETTALPLDDATAGKISTLFGQSFASISAAIKYAGEQGGVDLAFKTFTAGSNYAQGVNIPAATLDLTAYSLDANTPANVNLFVFLNGRLLHGGNGTTKNDVYAGTTPANGDLMVDFPKGIKTGDVILSIGLKE